MKVCQKTCFESKEEARKEKKRISATRIFRSKKAGSSRDSSKSNGKTTLYFCECCQSWHLSTMAANVSRIIKNKIKKRNNQ